MTIQSLEPPPPSDDKRWRIVATTMRRHGRSPHALIESLHSIQQAFGFLDDTGLRYVARSLRVPLSKAYGVATFYHAFTMKPQGEHACIVCMGTAYIKGGSHLLDAIEAAAHIKPGETTPDGQLSLLTARCVGSCGLAPVAVIDGQVHARLDATSVVEQISQWTKEATAA